VEIKILGPGCSSCKRLYAETERPVAQAGQPATLAKVKAIQDIVGYGVMRTPALVIDGRVMASGRIPDAAEIVTLIRAAAKA
jgi:small redox-active disulfide protein 2